MTVKSIIMIFIHLVFILQIVFAKKSEEDGEVTVSPQCAVGMTIIIIFCSLHFTCEYQVYYCILKNRCCGNSR